MEELKRRIESARAELTLDDGKREKCHAAHDAKWGMCVHGNHKLSECPGTDGQ
jgi:hypothetical protein